MDGDTALLALMWFAEMSACALTPASTSSLSVIDSPFFLPQTSRSEMTVYAIGSPYPQIVIL
jgi:hypothetical protein